MATVDTPSVKLSKTPLAQQTSVCGAPARPCSIFLASFALVVIAGTHILYGVLIFRLKASYGKKDLRKFDSTDDYSRDDNTPWYSSLKKSRNEYTHSSGMDDDQKRNYAYNVSGGGAIASGITLVITGIILLVGAIRVRPQLFYPWFMSMMFTIAFGRIVPIICSLFMEKKYLVFLIIMLCIDIVSIIILIFCWGQMAGLYRNEQYMKCDQNKPEIKANLDFTPPPGSYPQQAPL